MNATVDSLRHGTQALLDVMRSMGSGFTVEMITRINYSSTPELSSKGTTVGSLDSWHHRKCNCDNILAKCTNS